MLCLSIQYRFLRSSASNRQRVIKAKQRRSFFEQYLERVEREGRVLVDPPVDNLVKMLSYRPALDNPNYNEMETVLSLDSIPKEDLDDPFFMYYLLNEAYDLSYGIYDGYLDPHLRDQFGKIGVHPKEEITSGSLMDRWLKHFTQYGMAELFGMSFQEFISADVLTCVNMLETAKEAMRIKKKLYQELESPKGSKKDSGKKEG